MPRIPNLKIQLNHILDSKLRIGESKHAAKANYRQEHKGTDKYNNLKTENIHSVKTAHTYREAINDFGNYLRENHQDIWKTKDLENVSKEICYQYLKEQQEQGLAPYTISRNMSAMNKILELGLNKNEGELATRSINDITRSRNETNEKLTDSLRAKYQDQMAMALATGIRRQSMTRIQEKDFIKDKETGRAVALQVIEKGGKERIIPILKEYQNTITEIIANTPENTPIFDFYSQKIDNHSLRAEYAEKRYSELIQSKIDRGQEIQKDFRGYDKEIIQEVSYNLGHNRLNVVVEHYLGK